MQATVNTRLFSVFAVLFAASFFTGCQSDDDAVPEPDYTLNELYSWSIQDAMVAEDSEIIDTLRAITRDNPGLEWKTINGQDYVLLATFHRFPSSYPAGDSISNSWGASWLFIPGQMKSRIRARFTPESDTTLRINQLLGLPPDGSNTHISQIWVNPARLYRPAGDTLIHTSTATARLSSDVSRDYITWFNDYIIYAYYHPLESENDHHYPWTRLGYTYDWSPDTEEVGLSEYVLQAESGIWVEQTSTASAFFKE